METYGDRGEGEGGRGRESGGGVVGEEGGGERVLLRPI